jgi:hypothetical protein
MKLLFTTLLAAAATMQAAEWNKTWSVGGQPELRVEAADASIEMTGEGAGTIKATLITEGYSIGYDGVQVIEHQAGDHVDIRVKEPYHHGGWGRRSIRLRLTVPTQLTGVVKTGDGSISLRNVRGNLRVDTGDGSITGSDLGGTLSAHTGDGSMRLDGLFESLRLRTGDGSIQVHAHEGSKMTSDWDLQSGDGSIQIRLPRSFGADLQLRTGDGSIHTDLPVTVGGLRDRREVHGKLNGGGLVLNVHTGDGSISVGAS